MFIQKYLWAGLALCLAVGLGAYVGNLNKNSVNEGHVPIVRTYKVPAERAGELKSILNSLFWTEGENGKSKAQAFGNGLLLVKAPKSFQRGVRDLIRNVEARKATKDQKVSLDYWLVLAGGDQIKGSKSLFNLRKVVESINEVDGEQNYKILEHLSSNTGLGREAKVRGWLADAKTVVGAVDDNISLKMQFDSKFGEINTSTQVLDGEYVVLGQSAIRPKRLASYGFIDKNIKDGEINAKVYYVVRARVIK